MNPAATFQTVRLRLQFKHWVDSQEDTVGPYIKTLSLGLLFSLLGACGSGSNSSNQQFPLNDAVSAYMQMSHSYTLNWTQAGDSYSDQVEMQPGAQKSFQGTTAYTAVITSTVQRNGVLEYQDSITQYFLLGPYKNLGSIDNTFGQVTVAADNTALPDMARTGQTGAVDTEVTYLGMPGATISLTAYTNTWTLEGVDGNAKLCEVAAVDGEAERPFSTFACFTVDPKGNVISASLNVPTLAAPGGFN